MPARRIRPSRRSPPPAVIPSPPSCSRLPSFRSERLQLVSRSWAEQFATEPLLSTQLVVHVGKLEACPKWQRTLAARGRHTEELTLHTSAQPLGSYGGYSYSYDAYEE